MPPDKIFVQRHTEAGAIGDFDPAVNRLDFFVRQFVPKRRIFDAVFEKKGIATGR